MNEIKRHNIVYNFCNCQYLIPNVTYDLQLTCYVCVFHVVLHNMLYFIYKGGCLESCGNTA